MSGTWFFFKNYFFKLLSRIRIIIKEPWLFLKNNLFMIFGNNIASQAFFQKLIFFKVYPEARTWAEHVFFKNIFFSYSIKNRGLHTFFRNLFPEGRTCSCILKNKLFAQSICRREERWPFFQIVYPEGTCERTMNFFQKIFFLNFMFAKKFFLIKMCFEKKCKEKKFLKKNF